MTEKSIASEKRYHPRLDLLCLISFVESESESVNPPILMARTIDISTGGLKMETNEPLDPHSRLSLEIAIKERIFPLKGQVQYCRKLKNGNYISGIEFDQHIEEFSTAIRKSQKGAHFFHRRKRRNKIPK